MRRGRLIQRALLLLAIEQCLVAHVAHAQESDSPPDLMFVRRIPVVYPGSLDSQNRYQSTIRIEPPGAVAGAAARCSGSLIDPRLILTAAHCVCQKRQARPDDINRAPSKVTGATRPTVIPRATASKGKRIEFVTTSNDCAQQTVVRFIAYNSPDGKKIGAVSVKQKGLVRAHPNLELLYDGQNMVWSNADLAVIFLSEPLTKPNLLPYRLAETEVKVGDRVTMVGYGLGGGDEVDMSSEERRFGENRIIQINTLESGSVEFVTGAQKLERGQPAAQVYGGDSGGGCFKAGDNTVLVGVIGASAENAKGEKFSVLTSVYSHRPWLDSQVAEARAGQGAP